MEAELGLISALRWSMKERTRCGVMRSWSDLNPGFQQDAEVYLELRADPDLFDERPKAPKRPLAATTLRQQREHLRLAASVLAQNGEVVASLADLIRPER